MGDVHSYNGTSLDELACQAGLAGFVRSYSRASRNDALEFLAKAAMLVVLPQDSLMAIPAKVFEYMQFDNAMLVLASPDSATAQLLQGTEAEVVAPLDSSAIADAIRRRYAESRNGVRPQRLAHHRHLARAAQASRMFDFLEELRTSPSEPKPTSGL